MVKCTQFCNNLARLQISDCAIPFHEKLVERLAAKSGDSQAAWPLGSVAELRSRTDCGFCQLAIDAINNCVTDEEGDTHQVEVVIFPGEHSFRLSYPSRLGTRLAFVAEDIGGIPGPDSVRLISGSHVGLPMISGWIQTCDERHKGCVFKASGNNDTPKLNIFPHGFYSNFRVIDLELKCIKSAVFDSRYVALSYVWGQVPTAKLHRHNFDRLTEENSLNGVIEDLPKTIKDAIDLVRALGERYLWIDALCLIQDDEEDVSLGVELMHSIYRGSYFTIVAASGANANAGLPGISDSPRVLNQRIFEVAPGIRMTMQHSIDWYLARSVYNQRGWTLQELVLPQRTLIFVDDMVFFRCQEANWAEDSWSDSQIDWIDDDDSNISRLPSAGDDLLPFFWTYQKLCEEYSHRKLRSDGDALRAAAGILRPLEAGLQTTMVEGLPACYMSHFLLFISADGQMRRRENFASFSWAGWEGSVMWPRENYYWYDDGQCTWEIANVFKWMRCKGSLEYKSIDISGKSNELPRVKEDQPSLLTALLHEYEHILRSAVNEKPSKQDSMNSRYDFQPDSDFDLLNFHNGDDHFKTGKIGSRTTITLKNLNLINSQAELDQLVAHVVNVREKLLLHNWIASKRVRELPVCNRQLLFPKITLLKPPLVARTAISHGVESIGRVARSACETSHYRYRDFGSRGSQIASNSIQVKAETDDRARQGDGRAEENAGSEGDVKVLSSQIQQVHFESRNYGPRYILTEGNRDFRPYTLLQFRTISLDLILGYYPNTINKTPGVGKGRRALPFSRVQGIPLRNDTSRQVVGSLHPDNFGSLPEPGSKIECLILSRSQTPTVSSALLETSVNVREKGVESQPWDLFWIIYVVWKGGIAERRGIGQIQTSVLEKAIAPGPKVMDVLLG